MAHVRTAVRSALKAALMNNTQAQDRVFASRTAPIPADADNALRVWCKDEPDIKVGATGAGPAKLRLDRTLQVQVEILVRSVEDGEDAEEAADALLVEVETILSAQQSAGGVKWLKPRGIETDPDGDGDTNVVRLAVTYEALYFTALNAPEAAL